MIVGVAPYVSTVSMDLQFPCHEHDSMDTVFSAGPVDVMFVVSL